MHRAAPPERSTTRGGVDSSPPWGVDRPRLERRLDEALERRITTLVAAAGFGKSTLLREWAARHNSAWHSLTPDDRRVSSLTKALIQALRLRVPALPGDLLGTIDGALGPDADTDEPVRAGAYAAALCDALDRHMSRRLVLVLDDLQEIDDSAASVRLIESLCRQAPELLHIVLTSRQEIPFRIERLRGNGQVLEIAAAELAFTVEEIEALAGRALEDAGELAQQLHQTTDGWPVATRLAVEALRAVAPEDRPGTLQRAGAPGGAVFAYLAEEVFEREAAETRHLLQVTAPLGSCPPGLCEAIGVDPQALAGIARRGLFLEPSSLEEGRPTLAPLVRQFVLDNFPADPDEVTHLRRRAAAWYEEHGAWDDALAMYGAAGDHTEVVRVLHRGGGSLLTSGAGQAIIDAAEALPATLRDPIVEQLEGEARQVRGDWSGALACFRRIMPDEGPIRAGLAWRAGLIHHLRGELDEALAVYARGATGADGPTEDALLLGWWASALWLRGELERCRELAERSAAAAGTSGDDRGLAIANTVAAMLAALEGDRRANEAHYLQALEHAERAGDILQVIRVRVNRGSHHLEEGYYDEAMAELGVALRFADLAGFASFQALALTNRGVVHLHKGNLEEAIADLEAARSIHQRLGSRMIAYPLGHLGDVYRERGDAMLARGAYEEAVALAERAGDLQGLVPALAGLARVLLSDDPHTAVQLAERAVSLGPVVAHGSALLAAGWTHLATGNRPQAHSYAERALELARGRRDRAGLAEALELAVRAAPAPREKIDHLREALAIWTDLGHPLGQARAERALAELLEGPEALDMADAAATRFRRLGAREQAADTQSFIDALQRRTRPEVTIQSLGGFRVVLGDDPVPLSTWQSKKARVLLKVLVTRRGRPVAREALTEILWPGDDPAKTSNRLSVALTTVRSILDPDKRHDAGHYLAAERSAVALRLEHMHVDIEHFLNDVTAGLRAWEQGDSETATRMLTRAEAAYVGDFLEEDAYEEWTVDVREQARSGYVAAARILADAAERAGDFEASGRYRLRIIEKDPYDEGAHLGLVSSMVAAGRHGEARRLYQLYCTRMEEIDVEAAPFPARR